MDRKKYRSYTKEFKVQALELLENSDKTASELEREMGITTGMLLKWKQRYKVNKEAGKIEANDFPAAQAEIRRLKRELAIAEQERDILKKAIGIFSQKRD
jgi:transposase